MTQNLIKIGLATSLFAAPIQAALTSGIDQRYQGDDFNVGTGVWSDGVGGADATADGAFGTTTTPNGSTAVINSGAGTQMDFTGGLNLNVTGFTIQAVIQIADNTDRRQGPFGLDQSAGWGGLYAGARSNGNVESRAGTQTAGSNAGLLSASGTPAVAAGTWGILTLALDTSSATSPLSYSFDLLSDGSNVWSFTDVGNGTTDPTDAIGTSGRLFGGETGGAEGDTDDWQGAIADLIIYDSVLTAAELDANKAEFQSLSVAEFAFSEFI